MGKIQNEKKWSTRPSPISRPSATPESGRAIPMFYSEQHEQELLQEHSLGVYYGQPSQDGQTRGQAGQPGSACQATANSPTSEMYRLEGNGFYRQYVSSTNFQDQKKYLLKATQCYRKAYKQACDSKPCNTQDASSAAKNCGTALGKLVRIFIECKSDPMTIEMYYRETVEFFSKALATGKICMAYNWVRDIDGLLTGSVQSALKHAQENLPTDMIPGAIERLIQGMAENSQKTKCFWAMADIAFQLGVVSLGEQDFKAALSALHDCHRPIVESKRFLPFANLSARDHYTTEVAVMEQDVYFHLATAESLQAITIGDDLLKVATENQEHTEFNVNLDLVYDVTDWYRKAVVGAREIEVEVEGMALGRLGCLYDNVLKLKYKAKEYFLRCVQLGISLYRKNTESEDWFKKSMSTLKRYQEEAAKNDDVAHEQERQKYLGELVVELAQLESADTSSIELIRFVYKTFPPKDPNHTVPEEELKIGNVKKGLLKAILHYHPDKQNVAEHGKKWQTLCGEITRTFTGRYETRKGVRD